MTAAGGRAIPRRPRDSLPLIALALIVGLAACDAPRPPRQEAVAEEHPAYLTSRLDRAAVRAGYHERLNLGLGSPFRLVEFALSDPRLSPQDRGELARELLDRTAGGDLYDIDPSVLMPSGLPPGERVAQAAAHLELIEATVAGAADPRTGELAVRLAYRLALLERSVQAQIVPVAISVAALVRDREQAIDDARRLLSAARASGQSAEELVPVWRMTRRFQVEQPVVTPIAQRLQGQAIRSVPWVLSSIRRVRLGRAPAGHKRTRLRGDPEALERLRAITDSMNMPPRAPLVAALRGVGRALPASLEGPQRSAWADFEAAAWEEESFASRRAALSMGEPALGTAAAASQLYAAVGLRPYAQERVWYPGMPHPTLERLQARFGVTIRAGSDVEARWVPYFAVSLEQALVDLRRIFPELDLHGLTIEIPLESGNQRTLASYSAGTRTLRWPATTGPGTLAHEIAHDLDWQAARRANPRGRTYRSESPPASLAAALAILTQGGPAAPGTPPASRGHARRPAEVLARTFDWFVISRLGAMDRWNGTLSSAQDEVFTGNGSLGPPGVGQEYAPAVAEAVRSLVTIPREHRAAFLAEFGRLQWPGPNALLTALSARLERVDHDLPEPSTIELPTRSFTAIARIAETALDQLDSVRCQGRLPLTAPDRYLEDRKLLMQAAAASARGAALDAATHLGGPDAATWMAERFYGPSGAAAPQPADPAAADDDEMALMVPALETLAREALAVGVITIPVARSGFQFGSPLTACGPAARPLGFGR